MNKKAWLKLIETKLALLEPDAHTENQIEVMTAFYVSEVESVSTLYESESYRYEDQLEEVFSSFQNYYAHEESMHFTRMNL